MVEETEIQKSISQKKIILLDKILKLPIDEWTFNEQLRPLKNRQTKGYCIKTSDLYIWLFCREAAWRPFLCINGFEFFYSTSVLDDLEDSIKKHIESKKETEELKNINEILSKL